MSENPEIVQGMDHVLEMLTARASGQATNEQVEAAVQGVLGSFAPAAATSDVSPRSNEDKNVVERDTDDYDDDTPSAAATKR